MTLTWIHPNDTPITARACPDETIETRVFNTCMRAAEYAWTLMPHKRG
jgi:hypothetical protein